MIRFWGTFARLAWRDLRNSRSRSLFIVAAMGLSIAGITGIQGTADVARRALQFDSRAWLAADLCVDTRDPIDEKQIASLRRIPGAEWTVMTTTMTMAASDQSPDPGLIQVKAVDPRVYPFYGAIVLAPPQRLEVALGGSQVAVSEEVLERLRAGIGDSIKLGARMFQISGVITGEPDRFSNEVGVGMRCILSRESYAGTGIEASGNPVKNRVLLRLPENMPLERASAHLQNIFPEGNLRDYRGAHRQQTRIVELVISFVSLAAFLTLALGAIGVAVAMRQHAEHCLPTLAIMRMLGARSSQLAAVFFIQIASLISAAIAIGLPLGLAARGSLLAVAGKYLSLPAPRDDVWPLFETALSTILAMTPVLLQPALWIRNLRPALVLRKNMWTGGVERSSAKQSPIAWAAAALTAVLFAALAHKILNSVFSSAVIVVAIAAMIGLGALGGAILLRVVRGAPMRLKRRIPLTWHGIECLQRPGNRSVMLIAALAAALTMIIATFEGRAVVVRSILNLLPYDRDSLYLVGFRNSMRHDVVAFLRQLPGIEDIRILTEVRLHERSYTLPAVLKQAPRLERSPVWIAPDANGICARGYSLDIIDDGETGCIPEAFAATVIGDIAGSDLRSNLLRASGGLNSLTPDQWNRLCARLTGIRRLPDPSPPDHRRYPMTVDYYLDWLASSAAGGASYLAECDPTLASGKNHAAKLVLPPDVADQFHARPGSRLTFDLRDATVNAMVAAVRDLPPSERTWVSMSIDCSSLDERSLLRQAAVRIRPDRITSARQAILENYPTLGIISTEEMDHTVEMLSRDAMILIRVIASFAISLGLLVLSAMVVVSRAARASEIGILAALGARRRAIVAIYTAEFAAIGLLAGAIAASLACGFSAVAIGLILHHLQLVVDWRTLSGAVLVSGSAAILAGWLPMIGLLRRRPIEVLREE